MKNRDKIIIASFAKVGTQTVDKSLIKNGIHAQSIVRMRKWVKEGNQLFICGVRDFVGRNMSYFFQTISDTNQNDVRYKGNDYKGDYCFVGKPNEINKMSTNKLIDIFKSRAYIHKAPVLWFEEFFDMVGFDYKNQRFDKEKGYQIYELPNNNTLILYRLDFLDDMIKELNIFNKLVYNNIATNKWYNQKYKDFKNTIIFDDNYLNQQLDNHIMRFFYTDKEIKNFELKYKKNGVLGK